MSYDTQIIKKDIDWVAVKNECRTTVNKGFTESEPSEKFKKEILIAEHSPIRLMSITFSWSRIKSWVSVHFARHWLGWDKWISTQRSDRTNANRDNAPQDTLVKMDVKANPQALINVGRFRLCYQASPETREKMEDLKIAIHDEADEYIANVIVPNCVYRCGCPEQSCCRFFKIFKKWCANNGKSFDWSDIQSRYDAYNEWFYSAHQRKEIE